MSKTSARNLNAFFFLIILILRGKKSNKCNEQHRIFTAEAQVLKAWKASKQKIKINTTSHLVL